MIFMGGRDLRLTTKHWKLTFLLFLYLKVLHLKIVPIFIFNIPAVLTWGRGRDEGEVCG